MVTSYSISSFIKNKFQYVRSNLHRLVFAMSGKPLEKSQVVNKMNYFKLMDTISTKI